MHQELKSFLKRIFVSQYIVIFSVNCSFLFILYFVAIVQNVHACNIYTIVNVVIQSYMNVYLSKVLTERFFHSI